MRPEFVAGFVVAEACFVRTGGRHAFTIALGAVDAALCERLWDFFGAGHVYR
jgi:hypothetical protein